MISVLLAVYNGEKYLRDAIDSILNQTYTDFEFIIINDGSKDNSKEVILSYNDQRIVYVENEKNIGLSATLNKGIDLCTREYIARMDCDDFSLHHRFDRQVAYLNQHSNVGIVGSWTKVLGSQKVYTFPEHNDYIKARMLFNSMLSHPVVMMRKAMLNQYGLRYDKNYRYSQDYDLWVRAQQYFEIANIQEVLLEYREHPTQMRSSFGSYVTDEPIKTKMLQLHYFTGKNEMDEGMKLYLSILEARFRFTLKAYQSLIKWLKELSGLNEEKKYFDKPIFLEFLFMIWQMALIKIENYSPNIFLLIKSSPYFKMLNKKQRVFFLIKCFTWHKNVFKHQQPI